MKMIKLSLIIILMVMSLNGCKTGDSSIHYTSGTKALEAGEYDTAIEQLKLAVKLDPHLSRNRNNLAHAFFEKGMIEEGWPHIREAVILDPGNEYAHQNFRRYFRELIDRGDVETGLTLDQIIDKLGEPDNQIFRDGELICQFGWVALYFKNEALTGYNEMVFSK